MESLLKLLQDLLADPQQARLLFLAVLGCGVALLVATVGMVVINLRSPVKRRIESVKGRGRDAGAAAGGGLEGALQQMGARFVHPENTDSQSLRMRLLHAGFRSPNALQVFWAARLSLMAVLVGLALLAIPLVEALNATFEILLLVSAAGLGWLVPAIYLDNQRNTRMDSLRAAFPDALDLLVVCVESGLSLPQSIDRVADEMQVSHGDLAEELALVNAEVRAGVSSPGALRHLAERTGLEDVRGLVSLLSQSIRFGTSIADTLRIYADEFRDRRTQAAEEQAAKVGTKLIFPLILCLWPSFFVVVIGPAALGVLKVFGRM